MKIILIVLISLISYSGYSQIISAPILPTQTPLRNIDTVSCVLDNNINNISFAFSLRKIKSDYTGPLIRLRRSSDNSFRNFYPMDDDILIDTTSIKDWKGSDITYVSIWYDQSGLERNAVQNSFSKQPQFHLSGDHPYWKGDGSNDGLTVETGLKTVTNNGVEASIFTVMKASNNNNFSFGCGSVSDRWTGHVNWSNNYLYFDPGVCCNSPRRFNNVSKVETIALYSFLRTTTNVIVHVDGLEKMNGAFNNSNTTMDKYFGIGHGVGFPNNCSTNSMYEFIMYKNELPSSTISLLETQIKIYWNL